MLTENNNLSFVSIPTALKKKGKLAAVSGKMVKQTPESMKIRTPSSVMAVRGTEFVVQVDEPTATTTR